MICRGLRPRPQQECVTAMLCLRLGASSAFSFTRPERVTVSVPLDSREMMFELLMLDIVGDMRRLDLGRTFDLVFVHDAIMYATTLRTCARPLPPLIGTAGREVQ